MRSNSSDQDSNIRKPKERALPRALCPICNGVQTVSAAGTLTAHDQNGKRCQGTGGPPGSDLNEPIITRELTTDQRRALAAASRQAIDYRPARAKQPPQEIAPPAPRTHAPRAITPEMYVPWGMTPEAYASRRWAAAESQRKYEADAAARYQADLERGVVPTLPASQQPGSRGRITFVNAGAPGLGKR